jgi:MFS family permease
MQYAATGMFPTPSFNPPPTPKPIRLTQLFTTLNSFGALNIHILTTTLPSLLILLWTLASAILFGSASGAVIGLPPAFVAHILAPRPAQQAKLSQWTGMVYSYAAVPSLAGPVVVGHLITRYRSHVPVQVWSGVCLMASAGCMVVALGRGEGLEGEAFAGEGREEGDR